MLKRLAHFANIIFSAAIVGLGIYLGVVTIQRNAWLFDSGTAIQADIAHLDWEQAQRHVVELTGQIECTGVLQVTRKTSYMNTPVEEKAIALLHPFHDASSPRRIYVRFDLPLEHAIPCDKDTRVRGIWREFSDHDSLKALSAQQGGDLQPHGQAATWMLPHPDFSGAIEIVDEDLLKNLGGLLLYGLASLCVIGVGWARLYYLLVRQKGEEK